MDREVNAMGYGICIFSADTVQDFLKREKIRKRKLLSLLQKDIGRGCYPVPQGIFQGSFWKRCCRGRKIPGWKASRYV